MSIREMTLKEQSLLFAKLARDAYGDEKAVKKQWKEDTAAIMTQLLSLLEGTEDFGSENLETQVKQWISENELSFGKVMPPLRLVIVGEMKGPHIFDIMALIGKTDSINRIKTAITVL